MATNEEVLTAVSEIALDVGEIKVDIAKINQRDEDRQITIKEHHTSLYGKNGTRGLAARVQSLEETRAAVGTNTAFWRWVGQKVVSWAIIAVILWLALSWKKQGG